MPHIARDLVDRAAARLEHTRPEALDRRRFLLASGTSLAAALLAACDAQGPDWARRYLKLAERKNEGVERWLLRHTAMNHATAKNPRVRMNEAMRSRQPGDTIAATVVNSAALTSS